MLKRYEEALADFDRAIAIDEKYTWAIAHRGQTYGAMQRYEEALADFDRAIVLDEKSAWVIAGRGLVYLLLKRYEEALADFNQAIALDDSDDGYRFGRALVHLGIDQMDAFRNDLLCAIRLAQASLRNSPDDWDTKFSLAFYKLANDDVDSEAYFDQLISTCSLAHILAAKEGLDILILLQPSNEFSQRLLSKMLIYIVKLRSLIVDKSSS